MSDHIEDRYPLGEPRPVGYFMEYPTARQVKHYTRPLSFEERLSVISQGFHRGVETVHCYSLEEFAMALGKRVDSDPTGGIRTLDWAVFLPWLRDTIGDNELYKAVDAIVQEHPEQEAIETMRVLFFVRMDQYEEVLAEEGGHDAGYSK